MSAGAGTAFSILTAGCVRRPPPASLATFYAPCRSRVSPSALGATLPRLCAPSPPFFSLIAAPAAHPLLCTTRLGPHQPPGSSLLSHFCSYLPCGCGRLAYRAPPLPDTVPCSRSAIASNGTRTFPFACVPLRGCACLDPAPAVSDLTLLRTLPLLPPGSCHYMFDALLCSLPHSYRKFGLLL